MIWAISLFKERWMSYPLLHCTYIHPNCQNSKAWFDAEGIKTWKQIHEQEYTFFLLGCIYFCELDLFCENNSLQNQENQFLHFSVLFYILFYQFSMDFSFMKFLAFCEIITNGIMKINLAKCIHAKFVTNKGLLIFPF